MYNKIEILRRIAAFRQANSRNFQQPIADALDDIETLFCGYSSIDVHPGAEIVAMLRGLAEMSDSAAYIRFMVVFASTFLA